MHVRRTPRFTALGLTATLLLAGCSSGDDEPAAEEVVSAEVDDSDADDTDATEDVTAEDGSSDEDSEEETPTASSGQAIMLSAVPDVDWTAIEESPENLLQAPGASLRVTQTAQLEELQPEIASELSPAFRDTALRPADGEVFLVATVVTEDSQWDSAEAESEGAFRVAGSQVSALGFVAGSGERDQSTYLLSIPEGAAAQDAVVELTTGDVVQTLSLIDGSRVDSDVEHIYQAGTAITVDGDSWSHVFDGWTSGTHEVNGQVTGAVITPYVDGWARPGQVFVGVDIDARDNSGEDQDITTIQIELADGTTVTPEKDPSSLMNRFAERAWFQVPADSEELILHVNPMGKAGREEIDFESPVDVRLTIEGATASTGGAVGTQDPTDESTATEEPGSEG